MTLMQWARYYRSLYHGTLQHIKQRGEDDLGPHQPDENEEVINQLACDIRFKNGWRIVRWGILKEIPWFINMPWHPDHPVFKLCKDEDWIAIDPDGNVLLDTLDQKQVRYVGHFGNFLYESEFNEFIKTDMSWLPAPPEALKTDLDESIRADLSLIISNKPQ